MSTEEEQLIRAFIDIRKRDRLLGMLSNPKKRRKGTSEFAHFDGLDERWVVQIPPAQQHPPEIEELLRSRGAGDTCYVVSDDSDLDGRRLPLSEALRDVVGFGMGTLISCIPGELAYFKARDHRIGAFLIGRGQTVNDA